MIRRMACLFVFALILAPAAAAQNASNVKALTAAAEEWLGLIDQREYAESWKETATYFRKNVTEQKWDQCRQERETPQSP